MTEKGRTRSLNGTRFNCIGHCLPGPIPLGTDDARLCKYLHRSTAAEHCTERGESGWIRHNLATRMEGLTFRWEQTLRRHPALDAPIGSRVHGFVRIDSADYSATRRTGKCRSTVNRENVKWQENGCSSSGV